MNTSGFPLYRPIIGESFARANGKAPMSAATAAELTSLARPPEPRRVLADMTITFKGLRYSVPGVLPGDLVLVQPLAGSSALQVQFPYAGPQNTSASPAHSRNLLRTGRASSRPAHSGSSTSVHKKASRTPLRLSPGHCPARPPVRTLRRNGDSGNACNPEVAELHPLENW